MSPPQADKAGLHILLKLAALVIILAGIHAADSLEHIINPLAL